MASEKAMYWVAVCVLALGVANGLVSEHAGWTDRLADRSLSLLDRASETATRYAGVVAMRLDGDNLNLGNLDLRNLNLGDVNLGNQDGGNRLLARAEISAVRAQARLACVEGAMLAARVRRPVYRRKEFGSGSGSRLFVSSW
jgi:hypothetical protein